MATSTAYPYLVEGTATGYLQWDNGNQTPPVVVPGFKGKYHDLTQIGSVYYTFLIISVVVIVVGLIGNLMVITVILKHRSMRTTTNYYIFSLAVSDLFITAIAMPFKIISLMADAERSLLNNVICCIMEFIMPFVVFTSVWTLVAISLDRYLVIVHPLKSRNFNTKARATRNLIIIWTIPFVIFLPYFYPFEVHQFTLIGDFGVIKRLVCQHKLARAAATFERLYRIFQFFIIFVIPVGLLCFTCGSIARRLLHYTDDDKMLKNSVKKEEKGRRRVAKMVLVVVFAFTLCWLPHYIVSMIAGFTGLFQVANFIFVQVLAYTCGFMNSCMNPIIYALMSRAFRKGFWGILTTCCPRYRYLVGGKSQRRDPGHQSTSAVSEGVSNTTSHQGRRKPFVRAEMTQITGASSDADDDICLKKMHNRVNNDYVNSRNGRPTEIEDNTEKRQRLLNNLLDDADDKKDGGNYNSDPSTGITKDNSDNTGTENQETIPPVTSVNGNMTSSQNEGDTLVASPPLSPTSQVSMSPPGHFETQPLL